MENLVRSIRRLIEAAEPVEKEFEKNTAKLFKALDEKQKAFDKKKQKPSMRR